MKKLKLIIFILAIPTLIFAQTSEDLFKGESLLKDCLADIPLTYKKKDLDKYLNAADKYKNIEIIFLHIDKKTRKIQYERYFVEKFEKNDFRTVYLRKPENMSSDKPEMIFPPYNSKWDRFYIAECFDKKIKEIEN